MSSTELSPAHQVRHRCRNPRCGGKLKDPTEDPRNAFCCSGCFESYYRGRCLVCERPFERKTERRLICDRQKCRGEFRRHRERFSGVRYLASGLSHNASGNAHSTGLKNGSLAGRGFRIVAPRVPMSATAFQLATLPLDPELAARLDRVNAGHLAAKTGVPITTTTTTTTTTIIIITPRRRA